MTDESFLYLLLFVFLAVKALDFAFFVFAFLCALESLSRLWFCFVILNEVKDPYIEDNETTP